jgi:hypothetical protein
VRRLLHLLRPRRDDVARLFCPRRRPRTPHGHLLSPAGHRQPPAASPGATPSRLPPRPLRTPGRGTGKGSCSEGGRTRPPRATLSSRNCPCSTASSPSAP